MKLTFDPTTARRVDELGKRRHVIAYRNDGTNGKWQAIRFFDSFVDAKRVIRMMDCDSFNDSDLVIISYWERNDWQYGNINYGMMRWANTNPLSSALSGLINSRESDWF